MNKCETCGGRHSILNPDAFESDMKTTKKNGKPCTISCPACQKPEQAKKMHRKTCGLIGQDINNCECNKPTQKPEQGEAEIDITKIREDLQFLLENHPFDSVLEQVATYAYCALREVEKLKYN